MRLLFLTSRLPYPPDRGDRLRAFHLLRTFSQDHEITLISFIARKDEEAHLAPLQDHCREILVQLLPSWRSALGVLLNVWRPEPFQALYYRHPAMTRLVNRLAGSGRYDAAYIHLFRMAPYLADHPGLYRVVDLTDVISQEVSRSLPYRRGASRLLYALERPRIATYERQVAEGFQEAWLISDADRQVLSERAPGANLRLVPNGVNLEDLHPTGRGLDPDLLLFVGHMSVYHNVDAAGFLAEDILPRVRRAVPACRLRLVGADPAPRVQALGDLPGVTVAGFVPDLNAELNRAAVFVAPLRFAAGVQNKVLEALAAGRPVVTTSQVSEGLGATPGEHLLAGDDPNVLADLVVELIQNPARARAIGEAGRRFVARHFTWEAARRRMKEIENLL